MEFKIKIIVGFRRDQEYSISAEEAHKAYYLFLNPKERGIFDNGLAIIGSQIQEIVPDYQGTMGWKPTHILDVDDWEELRAKGVERKLRDMLYSGKELAQVLNPGQLKQPLSSFKEEIKAIQPNRGGVKSIGEMLK